MQCALKSSSRTLNCSDVIYPLLSHQTESFVWSSNTMYLSLGLRRCVCPFSARSAPPELSSASSREIANSYNSGSIRFQCTARAPPRSNFSAPYAGLRIPCSKIEILPCSGSARAPDFDRDRVHSVRAPSRTSWCPIDFVGSGEFCDAMLA